MLSELPKAESQKPRALSHLFWPLCFQGGLSPPHPTHHPLAPGRFRLHLGDRQGTDAASWGFQVCPRVCFLPPRGGYMSGGQRSYLLFLVSLPSAQYLYHKKPREIFLGGSAVLVWIFSCRTLNSNQLFHGSPMNKRAALSEAEVGSPKAPLWSTT